MDVILSWQESYASGEYGVIALFAPTRADMRHRVMEQRGRKHLATDRLQKRRVCWVLFLALFILCRSPFWDGSSPTAGNEIFSVLRSWNVYRVYR